MLVWDDSITNCQDITSDSSAASLAFFKRMMNTGYKELLARIGRTYTQNIQTADTVDSQQYYQCPPDLVKIRSITVTVDSVVYPVIEEPDQEIWDILNMNTQESDRPSKFFVREGFGVRGSEIGLYPTPSSDGNTITLRYESSDKDMAIDAYEEGTITLTNGSTTITGAGTETLTNKTLTAPAINTPTITEPTIQGVWDHWLPANETITCSTNNILTATAGFVTNLTLGDKFYCKDDGTDFFGYVIAKPSGTTFTVKGGSTSGVVAAIASSSTITVPKYSKATSPVGFPAGLTISTDTKLFIEGRKATVIGSFSMDSETTTLKDKTITHGFTFAAAPKIAGSAVSGWDSWAQVNAPIVNFTVPSTTNFVCRVVANSGSNLTTGAGPTIDYIAIGTI